MSLTLSEKQALDASPYSPKRGKPPARGEQLNLLGQVNLVDCVTAAEREARDAPDDPAMISLAEYCEREFDKAVATGVHDYPEPRPHEPAPPIPLEFHPRPRSFRDTWPCLHCGREYPDDALPDNNICPACKAQMDREAKEGIA